MHDHLEEGDCRDSNMFEVVGVALPWLCGIDGFLFDIGISVKSIAMFINELHVIVKLCVFPVS